MVSQFMRFPGIMILFLSSPAAGLVLGDELIDQVLSSNVIIEGHVIEVDCNQFRPDRYVCDFYINADEVIASFSYPEGEYGGDREADFKIKMHDFGVVPSDPYEHFFSDIGGYLAENSPAYFFLVCKTEVVGSYCALSEPNAIHLPSSDNPGLSPFVRSVVRNDWPMCISDWDNGIYRSILSGIQEIGSSSEKVVTVTDFLGHDRASVPYLILLMGEDSEIAPSVVMFPNPDDAFEKYAQYGFGHVSELIEALLYRYADRRVSTLQGTLQSHSEREHAEKAWRYWWNQNNCPDLNYAHIRQLSNPE